MKSIFPVFLVLLLLSCGSEEPSIEDTPGIEESLDEEVMPVEISVEVTPMVARALHKGEMTSETRELTAIVEEVGGSLTPTFVNTNDPQMMAQFTVEVPGMAAATEVVTKLQALDAVVSAFIKPAGEPPASP